MNTISLLFDKALNLGASDFGKSNNKTKRFYVVYQNKKINFGSKSGSTFIDHQNKDMLKGWRARHSKIINEDGTPFYKIKTSPEYWSWNLLWR